MPDLQTCDHCGTELDTSTMGAGQPFACGACGAEQVVPARGGAARRARAVPERVVRRGLRTDVRRRVKEVEDPREQAEVDEARARVRAGKRCATSVYICIAAIPAWFLGGFLVSAIVGLIAAVTAIWGLVELARVGSGPAPHACPPGVVRLGAAMARSGKQKGMLGLSIGLGLVGLFAVMFLLGRAKVEREEEQRQAWNDEWEERRGQQEKEMAAFAWLDGHVTPFTRIAQMTPETPLPDAEIARRLHAFLGEFPDSVGAQLLLETDRRRRYAIAGGSEQEPWVRWRGILSSSQAQDAESALPSAVEALIEAVGSRDSRAALAAIQALGEIGSPGAAKAIPVLEGVRDGDRDRLQNEATLALQKLQSE